MSHGCSMDGNMERATRSRERRILVTNAKQSCIWMSHVTHIWIRRVTGIWMSHVPHANQSCRANEWLMSHIWTSRVTRMSESCHTNERVMSRIWTIHVTRMSESCHTYERIMSHERICHATPVDELCPTWDMTHLIHMCDTTHLSGARWATRRHQRRILHLIRCG